jgi:hypothetical protein
MSFLCLPFRRKKAEPSSPEPSGRLTEKAAVPPGKGGVGESSGVAHTTQSRTLNMNTAVAAVRWLTSTKGTQTDILQGRV